MQHDTVPIGEARFHVASCGAGPVVVLLHGWPEFWLTWEPLMTRLAAAGYRCIAPDLRGFGLTEPAVDEPSDGVGANAHAADMLALLDALGLDSVQLVAHDVGAYVAQAMAHCAPQRLASLFFFDCPYPGIGARWNRPDHLREIWYQSFNQLPLARDLVGSSRTTCRAFVGHFLRHWAAGAPNAFDDVLDAFVANFMQPGRLQGGFNWYISQNASRLATMCGELPAPPRIAVPTAVRWGALDPVLKVEWADRLQDYFSELDFAPLDGVGHFPHREAPDRAAEEILGFLRRLPVLEPCRGV